MASPTHLLSWNVNGLRAVLKKGFDDFLARAQADVLCLQETKLSAELVEQFAFAGYPHVYWNCAAKKGYPAPPSSAKLRSPFATGLESKNTIAKAV